ncbi:hypothetical protein [Ferrimonas balearica]|uniref:hypothetical protein n=1 Tax=Ferrimonas balearica TaxID=44012 RepID=UPI001F2E6770|nr:hypothetical protein [Ferrimonas balearica]MBY6093807.1 hypothetical protein [Ferrimonas balearica]
MSAKTSQRASRKRLLRLQRLYVMGLFPVHPERIATRKMTGIRAHLRELSKCCPSQTWEEVE